MTDLTTSARVTLRVLVRGLPLPEGARHELSGQTILIMGRSKPSRWIGVEVQRGDLDGVAWSSAADVESVIDALQAHPKVVAVRRADDEPPPP